jgi:hypothetical protein
MSKRVLVGAVAVVAVKVGLLLVFRRWHLRWRATDAEVSAALPGDDLLPAADLTATRTIAIDAPGLRGVAMARAAGSRSRRAVQLRLPGKRRRPMRYPQHGPRPSRVAADLAWRSGTDPPAGVLGRRHRGTGSCVGPPGRRTGRRTTLPLRFHLGIHPQSPSRRHHPAGDEGAVLLQQPLVASDGGIHCHRQFRDEPEDVARHQGSHGGPAHPCTAARAESSREALPHQPR